MSAPTSRRRAEADERVAQPGVGGHHLGVAAQPGGERLPWVLDLERGADVVDRDAELLGDERLDQRVLRREVAVDGADADAGDTRHVVDLHMRALLRAHLAGGHEDALAVAPRIGPQGPFVGVGIGRHGSGSTGSLPCNRSRGSVFSRV